MHTCDSDRQEHLIVGNGDFKPHLQYYLYLICITYLYFNLFISALTSMFSTYVLFTYHVCKLYAHGFRTKNKHICILYYNEMQQLVFYRSMFKRTY